VELTISTRTLLRVLVTVALFIFVVDLRRDLHTVLLELLISLFLAVALSPLVAAVERNTRLSRGPAAILVFVLTIIVVVAFMIVLFTALQRGAELRRTVPTISRRPRTRAGSNSSTGATASSRS
jgi:predicted PurR-regulated permease PerM